MDRPSYRDAWTDRCSFKSLERLWGPPGRSRYLIRPSVHATKKKRGRRKRERRSGARKEKTKFRQRNKKNEGIKLRKGYQLSTIILPSVSKDNIWKFEIHFSFFYKEQQNKSEAVKYIDIATNKIIMMSLNINYLLA